MKIGLFDSGLGGLVIARAIMHHLPAYDFVYLGDTLRLPYGNRSHDSVYHFTTEAVDYLLRVENCQLVILACNTASARGLRKIQQTYLPQHFPNRRVLGVIIPTVEAVAALNYTRVGVLATAGTVKSNAYLTELAKLNSQIKLIQQAAPLLVPLLENDGLPYVEPIVRDYLAPLVNADIQALVLGCTHFPLLRPLLHRLLSPTIKLISQDDIIPAKLADYLNRHPEHTALLSKQGTRRFLVSDISPAFSDTAAHIMNQTVPLELLEWPHKD